MHSVMCKVLSIAIGMACIITTAVKADEMRHKFDGLGVQLWPGSRNFKARDELIQDLNLAFVRTSIGPCTNDIGNFPREQGDNLGQSRCLVAPQLKILREFQKEITVLGVKLHLVYWGVPERWRTDRGSAHIVNSSDIDEVANWLTDEIRFVYNFGFRPSAVELTNEPNGVWGTQFVPSDYARLVVLTRRRLDAVGLRAIQIEGPGTSNDNDGRFIAAIAPLAESGQLGLLSVHEYDTRSIPEPAGLQVTAPYLRRSGIKIPVYVTEFGSASPRWRSPPFNARSGRNSEEFAANSRDYGVSAAGEAIKLVADGASALFYWDLEDVDWAPPSVAGGLLKVDGRRRPAADALVVAFGDVRPGSLVQTLPSSSATMVAVCFEDHRGLTLVAANLGHDAKPLNGQILSVNSNLTFMRRQTYGSASVYAGSDGHFNISNGTLSGSIPPRTIVSETWK